MGSTIAAFPDARPANAASLIGSSIGDRYRLLKLIGEGGMGWVFQAETLPEGRTVALKLLLPELATVPQITSRFKLEAYVAKRLSHPNIVEVVDSGVLDGRLFLAMELLAGRSLAALIEQGDSPRRGKLRAALEYLMSGGRSAKRQLAVGRTVAIMRQVLDALKHAHSAGVVHRDLKPDNIMLVPGRAPFSRECVKLLDFGIAKLTDSDERARTKLTQLGVAMGTPSYMSPEQAMGQKADARSDLYSCGVILYEMLSGRPPFEAESTLEVLSMHLNAVPAPLRSVAPDARIPVAFESVVQRALAKRPEERFQSADEFADALGRAAADRRTSVEISGLEPTVLAVTPKAGKAQSRWGGVAAKTVLIGAVAAVIADHHLATRWPRGAPQASSSPTTAATPRVSRREPLNRPAAAGSRAAAEHPRPRTAQSRSPSVRSKPRDR